MNVKMVWKGTIWDVWTITLEENEQSSLETILHQWLEEHAEHATHPDTGLFEDQFARKLIRLMEKAEKTPGQEVPPKKTGRHPKLDDKAVKAARKQGKSLAELAKEFKVTRGAIQAALKR